VAASALASYGYSLRPGIEPEVSFVLIWTLAFAVASAVVSRVIYGLQRQVLEARQLGQYVLEDKLGKGGMGVVYRAQHAMLRRQTAVKLLSPEHVGVESLARFEREVRLTARLSHPNTVTIYDYGRTPDGTFYYAMELLDGADLEEIIEADQPMPAARVVHVLSCVAGALAEAHEAGLIHRDIKPANIILCHQGGVFDVPKVVDFGLVKHVSREATPDRAEEVLKTKANVILGTPHYIAPEGIQTPEAVDARSDIYALGAVGYFLLTGQTVFDGNSVIELCVKHLTESPVPPSRRCGRDIPAALEQVILDCLEKAPEQRPQSSDELLERLRDLNIPPWTARSARAWWQLHGAALRDRRSMRPGLSASVRTMAVNHERRTGASGIAGALDRERPGE
jgi:serine/threonine-protein kinase